MKPQDSTRLTQRKKIKKSCENLCNLWLLSSEMRRVILFSGLLIPQIVFAWCCGRIEGIVRDVKTRKPLTGVYIVVKNTSMWTTTNENGEYRMVEIPCTGEYEVVATLAGYRTKSRKIKVHPGASIIINFDLSKTAIQSGDVVLTDPKSLILWEDSDIYIDVINKNEIEAANIETVGEAIRWLTGIDAQKGEGWSRRVAKYRGLPPEYALVLLDDQIVTGGHGNSVDLDHYPVELVERIEVTKGPYSNLYGNGAIAGVINIISEFPRNINFAEYAVGTYDTKIHKLRHGIKRKNFGYILNYTRRESDGIDKSIDKFDASDFSTRLEFNLRPEMPKLVSTLIIDPAYYYQEDVNQSRKQKKYRLNTLWLLKPHEFGELKTRFSMYRYHHSYIMGDKKSEDDELIEGELYYTRIYKDAYFNASHRTNMGYHFLREDYNSPQVKAVDQTIHSFFFQDEIQFTNVNVIFSDRIDSYSQWDIKLSPKVGIFYKPGKDFRLRASIGRAFRNPSFSQLYSALFYMPGAGGMYITGNDTLKPEKATNYQLGIEYIGSKILAARVSLFRNDLNNMIILYTVDEDSMYGRPLKSYKNVEKAYTQGVEVEIRAQIIDRLSAKLGYTFLNTVGADSICDELPGNLSHNSTLGINFREPKYKFGMNLSAEYAGLRDTTIDLSIKDYLSAHMVHFKFYKDITEHTRAFVAVNNIFNKQYQGYEEIPETVFLSGLSIKF